MDNKTNTQQKTETGTLKKPTEMPNTGSNIRTSTVPKGPHPKLEMTGGRKPAAEASATGERGGSFYGLIPSWLR